MAMTVARELRDDGEGALELEGGGTTNPRLRRCEEIERAQPWPEEVRSGRMKLGAAVVTCRDCSPTGMVAGAGAC